MQTIFSVIRMWNRSTKQIKELATTKNSKKGTSRNGAAGVTWQCSKCCTCSVDGGCCVDDVVQIVLCRWCYLAGDLLMRLC